jgi:hypothetical protein
MDHCIGKNCTLDNSPQCKVIVVECCYMCKNDGGNVDHLLLRCEYARELCFLVLCLFGVQWVMPHKVLDLLACWKGRFAKREWSHLECCTFVSFVDYLEGA